jgi:hypothetical protein
MDVGAAARGDRLLVKLAIFRADWAPAIAKSRRDR